MHLAAALIVCMAPAALCQSSPAVLLQQAVAAEDAAKTSQARFTYFDLDHLENRDTKGKLYVSRTTLYEDTYIADLPYKRVIELEGKPLTGDELAREQARYDQAVAERKGLDAAARARLLNVKIVFKAPKPAEALSPSYRLTELRQEQIDGHLTHVLLAVPDPAATPRGTNEMEFWITDANPTLLRFTFSLLADTPTALVSSHGQEDFVLIDGVPLMKHVSAHVLYPNKGKTITMDIEHTYSRFRRFSASARILPDTPEVPPNP